MPNKNKIKGTGFERDIVNLLNDRIKSSHFKRTPTSGAMGTTLGEPILTGDVSGTVEALPKKIKIECKVGYGGATQFALKKEWLDKIKQEAVQYFSIPMLFGKFSGARGGVQTFVVLDFETFAELINYITELKEENDKISRNSRDI